MSAPTRTPPAKTAPATSPIKPTDTSATGNPPPAGNAPPAGATLAPEKAKRTRSAVSAERQLSLLLAGIIAAFDAGKLATDSPLGMAIAPARAVVKEINDKFVTPTKNRIAELTKELQAATADPAKINASQVVELSKELERLEKKLGKAVS